MKCKLKDIADVTMGQSPKSEFYNSNGEGYPFLQGNRTFGRKYTTFDTYTTKMTKKANAGDVIMSVRAPVGDLNITPVDICLGRGVCGIRMKNGKQDFLFYLMKHNIQQLLSKGAGTVFSSVNKNDINNLEIDIPDEEKQDKIALFLRQIDDKIEINEKINRNLLEQALAIYHKMFIETDNDKRSTCRTDEYFDITIGKTPPRKEKEWFSYNPNDCVWISISDMGSCGTFINDSSEYLTQEAVEKHNVKVVPDNTVILSFKLTVGRIAITVGPTATNEAIAHFNTSNDKIVEYLYCYLKSFDFGGLGSTSSIGTAVNSKTIKTMDFVIPENVELQDFHNIANPMFEQIKKNQFENQRLVKIRDSLLPKLMSSKIDISELDI